MADDDWSEFPAVEQPATGGDQPAGGEDWSAFPPVGQPAAEGMLATGAREVAHEALPAVAGAATGLAAAGPGAALGATIGSVVPGIGTVAGAAIGGIGGMLLGGAAGGYAASTVQETGLQALGIDDNAQRAVNAKTNPWSSAIGSAATAAIPFGVGAKVGPLARAGTAALMGGTEAASEYARGEDFSSAKILAGAAAGAATARPRGFLAGVEERGAALGERIFPHGTPGSKGAAGTAEAQAPPPEGTVADPQNKAVVGETGAREQGGENLNTTDYGKQAIPSELTAGVNLGEDPAITLALNRSLGETARPAEQSTQFGLALDQEFPRVPEQPPVESTAPSIRPHEITSLLDMARKPVDIYRAVTPENEGGNKSGHTWWSPSQDYVRNDAVSAESKITRIERARIDPSRILRSEQGFDPEELRDLIPQAVKDGYQAIEMDEGRGAPKSFYVIDQSALRDRGEPSVPPGLQGPQPGLQAMARRVRARARPTQTEPLAIGNEGRVLEAAEQRMPSPTGGGPPEPPVGGGGEPPIGQAPPPGGLPPEPPVQQAPPRPRTFLSDLQNIFAPQTRGPLARDLANQIRGAYGRSTQVNEQATDILRPHMPTVNAMSETDRRAMVNRIQGGNAFPEWRPTPAQQALMGDVKGVTDMWAGEIGKLDRAQGIDWVENYLPGMYKNGDQNQEFFRDWSQRAGGAGSLKAKTFPTYEEARAAGLEPYTDNPIEMLQLYGEKMRNFVGKQQVMERGLQNGTFIRPQMRPKVVGAAGAPEPLIRRALPPGYVESKNSPGVFMPEEVVKTWDNFHDVGLRGRYPNAYEAARGLNSAWTNLELSLNGYHAFTMANEGIISDVAMGIEKAAGGNILGAVKTIAGAPLAPYMRAKLGTRVQKGYLDPNSSDPITKTLVEQGGFRPIGRSHAQDSQVGQKTFLTSLKDLPQQLKQGVGEVRQDLLNSKGNYTELAKFPFRTAQRVIATVSHPLFDVYIPKLKAGAAYAQMEHWRDMNPTKIGTASETDAARKIVDSIDNRFGEMVTDHLFMNKAVQDGAVAGMRSFSWLVGSMKEIGGGAYAGARAPVRAVMTRDPSHLGVLNPRSEHYDPRVAYAIAMPMVIGITSAIYQKLLGSHDTPTNWQDLYAPRTGGTYKGSPEHMLMPGYHKDVYAWLSHPGTEAYAKLGGVWQLGAEELQGRETPALGGLPFIRPNATFLQNVTDRMNYALGKIGPIGVKALVKGQEKGSSIPAPLTAAGFHPTGAEISKPDVIHAIQAKKYAADYAQRQRRVQKERAARGYNDGGAVRNMQEGGPVEAPDYDYAAAQAAGVQPDERGHMPDTYKLPNHITFSTGSMHHGVGGNEGGTWSQLPGPPLDQNNPEGGNWMFTPGKTNLENYTPQQLSDYFARYEPSSVLNLPNIGSPDAR